MTKCSCDGLKSLSVFNVKYISLHGSVYQEIVIFVK